MAERKDYKVPALEKGLDILERLSSAKEAMSLTELSQALGRGSSELFRMVGYLVERGYITREPSGNYKLSLKLYELAHTHSPIEQLLRAAAIPMRELAQEVRESCHLSVLNNGELMVLYQQESPEKYRFSVEIGARYDAISSVSGRILLACLPEQERDYVLAGNAIFQSMDESARMRFLGKLEETTAQGYSYSQSETHVGVEDVAVLVGNPQIGVTASLCIPKLIRPTDSRSYLALLDPLKECAIKIAEAAGVSHD
jgi:DNA-binding IclR family transcriptional regulator